MEPDIKTIYISCVGVIAFLITASNIGVGESLIALLFCFILGIPLTVLVGLLLFLWSGLDT